MSGNFELTIREDSKILIISWFRFCNERKKEKQLLLNRENKINIGNTKSSLNFFETKHSQRYKKERTHISLGYLPSLRMSMIAVSDGKEKHFEKQELNFMSLGLPGKWKLRNFPLFSHESF